MEKWQKLVPGPGLRGVRACVRAGEVSVSTLLSGNGENARRGGGVQCAATATAAAGQDLGPLGRLSVGGRREGRMEGWDRRRRGMGWTAACSEDPRCARGGGGGGGCLCVDTYASHGRTRTEKHHASGTRALTRTRHRCARASPSTAAVRVGCRDLTSSCRSSPLESHAPLARTVQMALTAQHNSTTHKYSNSNRHYSSGTDKLKYVQLFTAKYDTTTALGQTPTGMCNGP